MDDIFGSDDEGSLENSKNVQSTMYQAGYRDGIGREQERQMQVGFDDGFTRSIAIGKKCGEFYAFLKNSSLRDSDQLSLHDRSVNCDTVLNILLSIPDRLLTEGSISDETISILTNLLSCYPTEVNEKFVVFLQDLKSIM